MKLYLNLKNGTPEIEASETPAEGFELYEVVKPGERELPDGLAAAWDALSEAVEDPEAGPYGVREAAVAMLGALAAHLGPVPDNRQPEEGASVNDSSAGRMRVILKRYAGLLGVSGEGGENIADILTDLRHYCDSESLDYAALDHLAYFHYRAERNRD